MTTIRSVTLIATAVAVAFASGCSYDIHTVTTPDPATLVKKTESNGLTLAADPLFPAERSQAVFNTDLVGDGILAIHVVVSNHTQAEQLVTKDSMRLLDSTGTPWVRLEAGGAAKSAHTSPVLTGFATGIPTFFLLFSGVIIGPTVAYETAKMNDNITADFQAKELKTRKLLVGETYGGFLFFRQPGDTKGIKALGGLKLEAQVENLATTETLTVSINL